MTKEHKRNLIAYNIPMILHRIVLCYDGSFYYQCKDTQDRNWTLQEHEIDTWV
jgi:hypothetical protein